MSNHPSRATLGAVFLFVCLIWGSSWAVTRIGLVDFRPIFAAGARFAIASIALLIFIRLRNERLPRDRTYWRLAGFLSMTAVTIPFALIYWGQLRVPSGVSSVLFGTFPFWIALLSHLFLSGQRLHIGKTAGVLIGFVGILLVSNVEIRIDGWDVALGVGAIIIGAFLQATALIAIIRFGMPYSPASLNVVPMAVGSFILLSASVLFEDLSTLSFTMSAIGALVFLALFSTVLTFLLYYWMAKHVQAVFLSFSAFLTPIVGIVTGWIALGETVTTEMLLGTAVVVVGIAIANLADTRVHSAPHP